MSVSLCTAFIRFSIDCVALTNAADVFAFIVLMPFRVLGVKLCVSLSCTTKVLLFSHICNVLGYCFAMFLDFLITFNYVVSGSLGQRFGAFAALVPHMPRSVARASVQCAAAPFSSHSLFSYLIIVKFPPIPTDLNFNNNVKIH